MKTNTAKKLGKGYGTLSKKYSIIKGARDCDYIEIKNALEEDPYCINEQDDLGLTASHISVLLRNLGVLTYLVDDPHFDPFITDAFNRRAIDCVIYPNMNEFRNLLMHKMYGVFPQLSR